MRQLLICESGSGQPPLHRGMVSGSLAQDFEEGCATQKVVVIFDVARVRFQNVKFPKSLTVLGLSLSRLALSDTSRVIRFAPT